MLEKLEKAREAKRRILEAPSTAQAGNSSVSLALEFLLQNTNTCMCTRNVRTYTYIHLLCYVELSGIVQNLIQKSKGMDTSFLSIFSFSRMSRASDNTKAAMKKQIRQIHSFLSHVRPRPFSFPSV